jgi:hypothetical protein
VVCNGYEIEARVVGSNFFSSNFWWGYFHPPTLTCVGVEPVVITVP